MNIVTTINFLKNEKGDFIIKNNTETVDRETRDIIFVGHAIIVKTMRYFMGV